MTTSIVLAYFLVQKVTKKHWGLQAPNIICLLLITIIRGLHPLNPRWELNTRQDFVLP